MKIIASLILIVSTLNFAQITDSLFETKTDSVNLVYSDSLLVLDSTSNKKSDIDTIIYASSNDSLIFFINQKKMSIYGGSELKYKNTEIKSANIYLDFVSSNIDAEGVPSDSLKDKLEGTPVLSDKGEVYDGQKIRYNFKTQQGIISGAHTEQEGAFYDGDKIKKVDKDTYFIKDGIYTTCDDSCPHYYFSASEMKVIHKEQIVAEMIWLNFGGVPLPIPIPFGVFPIESGRRSGIIAPAFGDDGTYGRYFSRFGYFWAISDIMDLTLTADYYTRGSYRLNSRYRYALRYNYTGSVEANYENLQTGADTDPDKSLQQNWRLKINHNQTITPTMRLDARLEFLSGNTLQRNINDLNELLRNDVISNATFTKTWDESGNSLSLNYSRTQNLESGDISEILPNMTFSKSQSYPFKRTDSSGDQKWYELFGYNYSSQLQNKRDKVDGTLSVRGGIQHNITMGMSPKIGYFSISPSFRYQEKWYNKKIEQYAVDLVSSDSDSIVSNDIHEINFVRTFNFGISTSTKFFGMFQPNVFGISAIRHTVSPSISYNYQPDFSDPKWGYYGSYKNSKGEVIKYNKYIKEVFGGASSGEQQSISFGLSNIFEMKTTVDPTDTTSKENKIQLLNLGAGISYNFAADSLRLSDLNINYRTQIGDVFNLSGSSTFTPYDYSATLSKVNRFLVNAGRGLLRMTNFSFSLSTSISGEKLKSDKDDDVEKTTVSQLQNQSNPLTQGESVYQGLYSNQDPDFTIPWDITLSYNFTQSSPKPDQKTKFSTLSGSLNFNLTPAWKFSVTGSYDIVGKDFSAPQIRISRDLHCWLMNFTWNPIGTYRGYFFEIRIKAPQLQDLKVTKRDAFYSGR